MAWTSRKQTAARKTTTAPRKPRSSSPPSDRPDPVLERWELEQADPMLAWDREQEEALAYHDAEEWEEARLEAQAEYERYLEEGAGAFERDIDGFLLDPSVLDD